MVLKRSHLHPFDTTSGLTQTASNYLIRAPINAQVAQSVEQRTENPRVGGSIPPLGTINTKGNPFDMPSCR